MRRGSRILLWLWALSSLVITAFVALGYFTSVAAGPDRVADMSHGHGTPFTATDRLVSVAVKSATDVQVFADPNATRVMDERGEVVLFGPQANGTRALDLFPGSTDAHIARALAYVEVNATRRTMDVPALGLHNVSDFNITGVPLYNATTGHRTNATLQVSLAPCPCAPIDASADRIAITLDAGKDAKGFLVKADALPRPEGSLVSLDLLQAKVAQVVPGAWLTGALVLTILSSLTPLALLILTQRPKPLPPGLTLEGTTPSATARCHECGSPVSDTGTFCLRCGAIRRAP